MGAIYVGTCSWSEFTEFYPPGLPSNQQIAYYAQRFAIVELNASFYRLMPAHNYAAWARRTPAGFLFDVKPFRQLTWHDRREPPTPDVAATFSASVGPLREAGKLGALTFQFPPWFTRSATNLAYLRTLRDQFPNDPLSVEFRHNSWLRPEALPELQQALSEAHIALGIVDEPQVGSGSIPTVPVVTTPELSVVRFHGRNAAKWYAEVERASDRFDYLYSLEELDEWVPKLAVLADQAQQVHVLFNNNVHDYAVTNALQLHERLRLALGSQVVMPTSPVLPL